MNIKFYVIMGLILCGFSVTGRQALAEDAVVYIAHVNDTHSHIEPSESVLSMSNTEYVVQVGGYPRLHTQIDVWRGMAEKEGAGFLFLHGGDAFQGSGYFILFQGTPDIELLNRMGLDAMVLGNHEFDKLRPMTLETNEQGAVTSIVPGASFPDDEKLAAFIRSAHFPLVAANVLMNDQSPLYGLPQLMPYTIKEVQGEKIGIFGIVLGNMPAVSNPDKGLIFLPEADTARKIVALLKEQGVDRIIMVSHIGYEKDQQLAREVDGIDVIVGGHSHSVLGDFSSVGMVDEGAYPTWVTTPSGGKTAVVQAGCYARFAGLLKITFDEQGNVIDADSANTLLAVSDEVLFPERDMKVGEGAMISWHPEYQQDRQFIEENFAADVKKAYGPIIANVTSPLTHERVPTDLAGHGSLLAPVAAESLAFELAKRGQPVDFAFVNAGGIRTSISSGPYYENQTLMEVMIFGNKVATFDLTGRQIKDVFEEVITVALTDPDNDGRFPYSARLKYTYDSSLPEGRRIVDVTVLDGNGAWIGLDDAKTYHVAANNYVASGRDGYSTLKALIDANGACSVVDCMDNQMFTEYIKNQAAAEFGSFSGLDYFPVTLKK